LDKFMGFWREGRPPGIRNDLWIIPTSLGVCEALRRMCADYHKPYWIDSVTLLGAARLFLAVGRSGARDILKGVASNSNACGVLAAGPAGGDLNVLDLVEMMRTARGGGSHVRNMIVEASDPVRPETAKVFGATLDGLAANAARTRKAFPLSDIRVGAVLSPGESCAGANSAVRRFSGWFTASGGTVLLSNPDSDIHETCASLLSRGAHVILAAVPPGAILECAAPVITVSDDGSVNNFEGFDSDAESSKSPDDIPIRLAKAILRVASGEKTDMEISRRAS
jgi:altronate dehydratase